MSIQAMKQALSYNAKTGIFTWVVSQSNPVAPGTVAGSKKRNGYIEIQFHGRMHKAHRVAWMFVHGELPPNLEVDHIDGNRSNNCINNLRVGNHSLNQQNKHSARKDSSTGFLGVSKNGSGWRAEIRVGGKKKNLGTYPTPEVAHEAYLHAKRIHHEGCTI